MSDGLSEAALISRLSRPQGAWSEVEVHREVTSTNALSLADPRPWRLVTAGAQTAARGRRERVWISPARASAPMSFTVPLPDDPAQWGWLPLVTGLAVHDGLARVTGAPERFSLKWPNDVLLETDGVPGKVCGILCEAHGGYVVVGIGVNVAMRREELPVPTAASLLLAGFDVEREDVIAGIAEAFAGLYRAWLSGEDEQADVRARYRAVCSTIGAVVDVHLPDGTIATGPAVAVADDGELVVETPGGVRSLAAGDVVHVRPAGDPRR